MRSEPKEASVASLQKQMNPRVAAVRCSRCLDSSCAVVKPLLTGLLFLVNRHSRGGMVVRDAVNGPVRREGGEQLKTPRSSVWNSAFHKSCRRVALVYSEEVYLDLEE